MRAGGVQLSGGERGNLLSECIEDYGFEERCWKGGYVFGCSRRERQEDLSYVDPTNLSGGTPELPSHTVNS